MNKEIEILAEYDDVLTRKELQRILKCGRSKAYELLQNGVIQSRRLGSEYRILKSVVIQFLEGSSDV